MSNLLFEWDEVKRLRNLQKHGIDFVDAQALFDADGVYTYPSPRRGEERWVTVGYVTGRLIALVWIRRREAVRLISARKARREEQKQYCELFG